MTKESKYMIVKKEFFVLSEGMDTSLVLRKTGPL
jgi:hypothetical protein